MLARCCFTKGHETLASGKKTGIGTLKITAEYPPMRGQGCGRTGVFVFWKALVLHCCQNVITRKNPLKYFLIGPQIFLTLL
jgi:hypothetical protein